MASRYVLQIVDTYDHTVVHAFEPRAAEVRIVPEVLARTRAKGVGFFRTEAHVMRDLEQALLEMFLDLKAVV